MKKISGLVLLFSAGVFVFPIFSAKAQSASLYLSPSTGTYTVGNSFSVAVKVNTGETAINAIEGSLTFETDDFEIVNLSKSGSILTIWTSEPSFSNSAGTINFSGGLPTPGFTGSSGTILTIVFKVKTAGTGIVDFSSGAVLANDGKGTNILANMGGGRYTLKPSVYAPTPSTPSPSPAPAAKGVPAAPVVTSETHPDQNKWYPLADAKLSWLLSNDITASRLLLSHTADAAPLVVYTPAVNSKEFTDLEDGVWYFHAQLRNSRGWGEITHFRLQIDTEPPAPFTIKFVDGKETDNPRPTVLFDTTDALSGIDYYKVKIGEGDSFMASTETTKSNPYVLPIQAPGKRSVLVQAFDKAGNFSTASEEFVIKPIESPKITEYPKQLRSDEIFQIKGTAYPNAQVTVWLQHEKDEPKSQFVKSDQDGNFLFIAEEKLKDGIYKLWGEVTDERGAKSNPSDKINFTVILPLQIRISQFVIGYVTIISTLLIILIGLAALAFYAWYKLKLWRRLVKKETIDAEKKLRRAFSALSQEVKKQVSKLDGYEGLSEREKIIYERLKKALETSEKFVGKEIKDIERELKK